MGRITVFSVDGCGHCRRAKKAMSARNIPYAEINLSLHASRTKDAVDMSNGRMTVPQVFFNSVHVGGADEAIAALERWDIEAAAASAATVVRNSLYSSSEQITAWDRYAEEVESLPDPTDERLAVPPPTTPGDGDDDDAFFARGEDISIPGTALKYSVLELTRLLMEGMPCGTLPWRGMTYYRSFKGCDGVAALLELFKLETRKEAVAVGRMLLKNQFLDHVTSDHDFFDDGYFYRLQPNHRPNVLNSFCFWGDSKYRDPAKVLARLSKLWSKIEDRHADDDGLVDYASIRSDDDYWKFEEAFCEVQAAHVSEMDGPTKLSFVANLYNLMINYAFAKVGVPRSTITRGQFFDRVRVALGGGFVYSFSDLENGILRANSRPPYKLSVPFGKSDPRRKWIAESVDPRIHFALNCGARSCPPVKKYTAGGLEDELTTVALAFCEGDDSVKIVEEKGEVHLSKIFDWYRPDFGDSKKALPAKVAEYLTGERKQTLERMMVKFGSVTVKFLEYDWSTNDCQSKAFEDTTYKTRRISFIGPPKNNCMSLSEADLKNCVE